MIQHHVTMRFHFKCALKPSYMRICAMQWSTFPRNCLGRISQPLPHGNLFSFDIRTILSQIQQRLSFLSIKNGNQLGEPLKIDQSVQACAEERKCSQCTSGTAGTRLDTFSNIQRFPCAINCAPYPSPTKHRFHQQSDLIPATEQTSNRTSG